MEAVRKYDKYPIDTTILEQLKKLNYKTKMGEIKWQDQKKSY